MTLARALLAAVAVAGCTGVAYGADLIDIGQQDYEVKCAVCHGLDGKGQGSYVAMLTVPVPDLTVLARNNGGVFPFHYVYRVIDGREEKQAHGPRDMPIWGQDYLDKAEKAFFGYSLSREGFVRSRILALIDYLHRLQQE